MAFAGLILIFVTVSSLAQLFIRNLQKRRKLLSRWVSFCSSQALKVFGVKIEFDGREGQLRTPQLMVSNHLGYLDVLVMATLAPCAFVTSVEIKNTPFLGWLTELAGCLYVERRNRSNLGLEISDIKAELENGLSVCIFPEATSTNGESVIRFRKPLYQAAIDSGRPVLPLCINYTHIDRRPTSIANRDFVCWYGDMEFLGHLWAFFSKEVIHVTVSAQETLCSKEINCPASLAEQSHLRVLTAFRPFSPVI